MDQVETELQRRAEETPGMSENNRCKQHLALTFFFISLFKCVFHLPSSRGRQTIVAVRRLFQHCRRVSGGHLAPLEVPRSLPTLLGQRQPAQRGNILRACCGAAGLQEGAGPRQQHLDLCCPSCGVPSRQKERSCYSRHNSAGRGSWGSYISRLSLHEEEAQSL